MLKYSTHLRTLPILQEAFRLIQHGSSAAFAESLIDTFAEVGQRLYEAEPRTPQTTTFRQWCEEVLRPAAGGLS